MFRVLYINQRFHIVRANGEDTVRVIATLPHALRRVRWQKTPAAHGSHHTLSGPFDITTMGPRP